MDVHSDMYQSHSFISVLSHSFPFSISFPLLYRRSFDTHSYPVTLSAHPCIIFLCYSLYSTSTSRLDVVLLWFTFLFHCSGHIPTIFFTYISSISDIRYILVYRYHLIICPRRDRGSKFLLK
ncbi:hypothetical protein J3R30DRAFT_1597209 [Lentinula aciculospora]|uniref:Uncharacterized protein n=1 Tax=Lentinula aciculospora TaxID=153920 RepID=A0A9W8ZWF7_9AGAR|nr:hypothetical protein J3R30DRAFT_1597209 [Lentinula aciculospora]